MPVFTLAVEAAVAADELARLLPRVHLYLADQLRRAASSIVLNIGEGAGEHRSPEKARFYRIARRSATEASAVLELAIALRLLERPTIATAKERLITVAGMLTRLCRRFEAAPHPRSDGSRPPVRTD